MLFVVFKMDELSEITVEKFRIWSLKMWNLGCV